MVEVKAPGQTLFTSHLRDGEDRPLAEVRIPLGGTCLTPLGTTDAGGTS